MKMTLSPQATNDEIVRRLTETFNECGDDEKGIASRAAVEDLVASQSDTTILDLLVHTKARIEYLIQPLRWVERVLENEIGRRLHERREERGNDTATIAMAHPRVDVELTAQFKSYEVDTDALRTVLPALKEEDAAKLLVITPSYVEPAYTVPARIVPESVQPRTITAIKAVAKKYAGSAVGKVIEGAIHRDRLPDKITIKPVKTPLRPLRPGNDPFGDD